MTPYYQQDGITIFCCDCRDVLPMIEPGSVDLVLTDPPYGIAAVWKGGFGRGWSKARLLTSERNSWDEVAPDSEILKRIVEVGKDAVVWGGNYFSLPPSRGWLVCNKPERNFSLSEAELAWTTRDNVIRVGDFHRSDSGRIHPTQKPLRLMTWCLSLFPNADTIFDPFMGSGTTLVAAKNLGRKAIGIEISREYCDIAIQRLQQSVLPLSSKQDMPQQTMFDSVTGPTEDAGI